MRTSIVTMKAQPTNRKRLMKVTCSISRPISIIEWWPVIKWIITPATSQVIHQVLRVWMESKRWMNTQSKRMRKHLLFCMEIRVKWAAVNIFNNNITIKCYNNNNMSTIISRIRIHRAVCSCKMTLMNHWVHHKSTMRILLISIVTLSQRMYCTIIISSTRIIRC